jgi:hypothetical protein
VLDSKMRGRNSRVSLSAPTVLTSR